MKIGRNEASSSAAIQRHSTVSAFTFFTSIRNIFWPFVSTTGPLRHNLEKPFHLCLHYRITALGHHCRMHFLAFSPSGQEANRTKCLWWLQKRCLKNLNITSLECCCCKDINIQGLLKGFWFAEYWNISTSLIYLIYLFIHLFVYLKCTEVLYNCFSQRKHALSYVI